MVILKEIEEENIDITWLCNKWISFKFFEDVIISSKESSDLIEKIVLLNKWKLDTLDLMDFPNSIEKFKTIIQNVIQYNKETQGADMHDPSYFQVYFDKVLELKDMFYETYGFNDEEE